MSLHEYRVSRRLALMEPPFYALVMAAMRKADDTNLGLLKAGWPDVWGELDARYNAPGGRFDSDPGYALTDDEAAEVLRVSGERDDAVMRGLGDQQDGLATAETEEYR